MKVDRQFIAWNVSKRRPVRRDGVSQGTRCIHRQRKKNVLSTQSYRPLFFVTTKHFVPGYVYLVPPGQRLSSSFGITNRLSPPRGYDV